MMAVEVIVKVSDWEVSRESARWAAPPTHLGIQQSHTCDCSSTFCQEASTPSRVRSTRTDRENGKRLYNSFGDACEKLREVRR